MINVCYGSINSGMLQLSTNSFQGSHWPIFWDYETLIASNKGQDNPVHLGHSDQPWGGHIHARTKV